MDWKELTDLTGGRDFVVERVRLLDAEVAIEGRFEPPALAKLPVEDQIFAVAFLRSHGSIKEMEQLFGVSYPTIKNRLNRIAERLEFVEIGAALPWDPVLERLERGEITVAEALAQLRK